jgi:hypothetical protein
MAKENVTLMFNKGNKALIGAVPAGVDKSIINTGEIYLKDLSYDPETHTWNGPYDTGSLQVISDITVNDQIIDEEMLDANVADTIGETYPLYKQMNIIIDMLDKNGAVTNTAEFTELVTFLKDQRDRNNARKEVYKQDGTPYEFLSKEDLRTAVKKRMGEE